MKVTVDKDKCGWCTGCVAVCPLRSIHIRNGKIEIDDNCTNCGICVKFCPAEAINEG